MFQTDPVLMARLAEMVASNGALAVVFPPVVQIVTGRFTDNTHKKNAAWITCFIMSMILAAILGAFAPVVDIFQSQGALPGIVALFKVIAASFGVLLTGSALMFDKFYQPTAKAASGEPAQAATVKTLLEEKILEQTGIKTTVGIKGVDKVQGYVSAANAISQLFTKKKDPPKGPANESPAPFDPTEGSPTLDPEK